MSASTYLLAGQVSELERLQLQSRVWEPSGRRLLDEIGNGRGARAVDIGCGVLGWLRLLSEWVGPEGEVVGTDIDEAMLAAAGQFVTDEGLGNVVLRNDDLFATRLEPAAFDLVHARFELTPLGRCREQMQTYLQLLRPGGTVVVEDPDWGSWHFNPPAPAAEKLIALIREAFGHWGDAEAGRKQLELLRGFGIAGHVRAEVLALPPGHPYLRLPLQFVSAMQTRLHAFVAECELERLRQEADAELQDSGRWGTTFTLLQSWGKPVSQLREQRQRVLPSPTQTISGDLAALRAAMSGPVFGPNDEGYDEARKVWNADIDRRPAVIVRCTSTADVRAGIAFAQEAGREISVRCGAHNAAGAAVCDDGLMVDLSLLNQVTVDPEARRARVGGGALLRDVDAATQAHRLAVPLGLIGHTGVGGIALGGGMGWLTRKFGLTADNLVAAEVVTADGRVLRAAADEHADLFWALRGGGGNFGVVTQFEFQLHEVDPMVDFGLFFWGLDQGPEMLRLARKIVAGMSTDSSVVIGAVNAPPAPFVPEQHQLVPGYVMLVVGFDGTPEHAQLVARIRTELPPLFDLVTPMPYTELQQLLDEGNDWGNYCYTKPAYVEDLSDGVIEVLAEHVPRKLSPMSLLLFYRLDEAFSRVDEHDTAFAGGRSPRFIAFFVGCAPDPSMLAADRTWVQDGWEALRPHAVGREGYLNEYMELEDATLRRAFGSAKYDRLARIKGEYDPDNVFRHNANIKPM